MNYIFDFCGQTIVVAHIESYWIEAGDIIKIRLSSGVVLAQQYTAEEAPLIKKNIEDAITGNQHI